MKRGEIYWAELGPPAGRRPVVVLSRNAAIPVLSGVVVAPITTSVRKIASEVELGRANGLSEPSAATCDNILTVPNTIIDGTLVGALSVGQTVKLDRALRFALEIAY